MRTVKFRFEDLHIWQIAIGISDELFDIADELEQLKLYRYSEQMRGAVMSITNNIAEGSGSTSNADFANFLKFSRRSAFEVVNILIILNRRKKVDDKVLDKYLEKLDELCRKISNFRKSLLNGRRGHSA
jgi:four helix bundle protein